MKTTTATFGGDVDAGYEAVADAFRRNFTEGREVGAAVAVYRDGRKVVDLWGGLADLRRGEPWREDTMVTVFSTTKGMASIAMAVAHSRGLFDLDVPLATYWPEFGQHGKERVTVRELMAHRAGVPVIDVPIDLAMLADHDVMGDVLAAQAPKWEPGTAQGYHGQSLGWCESQLLRRVDPHRRTVGRFFAEEVAGPLGLDFHIGIAPGSQAATSKRVAVLEMSRPIAALLHMREMPVRLALAVANPRSLTSRMLMNPKALRSLNDVTNREVLAIELPSTNGTGEVRAIAKAYGATVTRAPELGLRDETMAELVAPAAPVRDRLLKADVAFSFGFMKPCPMVQFGSSASSFGHTGLGGSFAFADPDLGLGFAYGMNRLGMAVPTDIREQSIRRALYDAIG